MKRIIIKLLFFSVLAFSTKGFSQQDEWPKTINGIDGSVLKVYKPEPESFSGNTLKSRSAISLLESGKTDPTFGTFWAVSTVETDKDDRVVNIESVHVPNLKFSDAVSDDQIAFLKTTLETQLPQVENNLPLDDILASLNQNVEQKKLSSNLSNTPPKIYYSQNPSILVLIDGAPKYKRNQDWGVDVVVNTPFTLVKSADGNSYLYGNKQWYSAKDVMGPYSIVNKVSPDLQKIATAVNNANTSDPAFSDSASTSEGNVISDIIVSTTPAELVQTNGTPQFTNIDGTNLQYASNSGNDIFLDNNSEYYVLISGRWYKSNDLNSGWNYVASNQLPSDFSKIPEGSPKDNVLASVAGTNAAREAIIDAQIPQTAKVDRHSATTTVTYDGAPQFQPIPGTGMQYAVNSQTSVIEQNGRYYAVDKGVWFVSDNAEGPWQVSTDRPDDVDNIPPTNPDYNVKYVYVYDNTPDYVYMGYTPGYLNTFIYGPTVVYGTGFNYNPWYGDYFYPRPYTWGFGMNYNPWYGWGLGFNYGLGGWFNCGFGYRTWGGWGGGWWGPSIYRPPFYAGGYYHSGYSGGGFYGRGINGYGGRNVVINRNTNIIRNTYRTNNVYGLRRDVVTRNNQLRTTNTPSIQNNRLQQNAGAINNNRSSQVRRNGNSVYTDQAGNVYRNNGNNWQQRQQRNWSPVNNTSTTQNLNQQRQMQSRGEMRTQSFQMSRSQAAPAPSIPSNGGGGSFRGGGGGGRPAGGGGRPH